MSAIAQFGEGKENKMGRKVLAFHYIEEFPDGGGVDSYWLFLMYYPEAVFVHNPYVVKGRTTRSFRTYADAAESYETELMQHRLTVEKTLT